MTESCVLSFSLPEFQCREDSHHWLAQILQYSADSLTGLRFRVTTVAAEQILSVVNGLSKEFLISSIPQHCASINNNRKAFSVGLSLVRGPRQSQSDIHRVQEWNFWIRVIFLILKPFVNINIKAYEHTYVYFGVTICP